MKISDIFRQSSSEELKGGQDSKNVERAGRVVGDNASGSNAGEDTVSLSPLSRKLSQISRIVADDEAARQQRVDELKQQVANGEYSVDSEDAAQSLLDYVNDRIVNE